MARTLWGERPLIQRLPHWRAREQPIRWVEHVCDAPKAWGLLVALPPKAAHLEEWEAQIHLLTQDQRLRQWEPLWLRAHREESGAMIVSLFAQGGAQVLRRGHIGGGHQEPDAGPFLEGPHIHFPTTVFREVGSRGGRSRVYPWRVDHGVSLREAITSFADALGIMGQPEERPPLFGESHGV